MKIALTILFLFLQTAIWADTCSSSKTCDGDPPDEVSCQVTIPENGTCRIIVFPDKIECVAYNQDDEVVEQKVDFCWNQTGTGEPEPCDGGLSGAWWVGCDPFAAY